MLRIALKAKIIFLAARFLITVMGKIKRATKARSKGGGRGRRRKTAAASNEERNFKQEMLAAMATIGYVFADPSAYT